MLPTEAQRRSVVMSCFQPTFAEYYQVCLDLSCSLVAIRKEHILVHVRGQRKHSSEVLLLNRVTIVGGPESQWKAQYLIFEKLREEVNDESSERMHFPAKKIKLFCRSKLLFRVSALGLRMFGSQLRSLSHPPRF